MYIGRLLRIADRRERSVQEISEETGIPTGKFTGKVKPHIEYARYMGLIEKEDSRAPPWVKWFSPMNPWSLKH